MGRAGLSEKTSAEAAAATSAVASSSAVPPSEGCIGYAHRLPRAALEDAVMEEWPATNPVEALRGLPDLPPDRAFHSGADASIVISALTCAPGRPAPCRR